MIWWCAWEIKINPSARCVSLEKSLHNCDCTISSSVWAHTHVRLEHTLNKGLHEKMRANTVKEDRSQIIISSTFYKKWPVLSLPEELNHSQALIPLFITVSIRPDDLLWKTTSTAYRWHLSHRKGHESTAWGKWQQSFHVANFSMHHFRVTICRELLSQDRKRGISM